MFVTGPKVVQTVTHEEVTDMDLGGAMVHASKSGVAHFVAEDEKEGILLIRKLLSYLPQNNLEDAPMLACSDPVDRQEDVLNTIIPENANKPYDVKDIIHAIADDYEFMETARYFAPNMVTGFARFDGKSVGIVANQPNYLAGVLDINSSRKAARFVRFCDAFNIPILTLVDVPGFLPGTAQEYGGIIIHGAKLLYAYGEATVPKVTIVLRKAYGGAYDVMSSKHLRGDINYAWPSAEIAVMGAKGAIEILHHKKLAAIEDPAEREKALKDYEAEYLDKFANPYDAASYGFIDDVIIPRSTRFRVIRAFQALATKKETNPAKKHGNIPL
jgi:acetyl-CoA carboxylase carboxyltransferase component